MAVFGTICIQRMTIGSSFRRRLAAYSGDEEHRRPSRGRTSYTSNNRGPECDANIRRWIHQELIEEFRRYGAVIADPQTPAVALEVVTNDARAAAFFESLLQSFDIPGEVIVRP